jgi:triosephosphate isomerase
MRKNIVAGNWKMNKSGEDKQRCQQKAAGIYPDELYNMFFLSLQTLS